MSEPLIGSAFCDEETLSDELPDAALEAAADDRGLQKPFQLRQKENSSCESWL